ncbi:hypothetical protein DFH09DRAFT_858520, partial [Mycena vulgaris]
MDQVITSLVSTNHASTSPEVQHVQVLVLATEAELVTLNEHIPGAQKVFADLRAKRKQQSISLTSLRAILSPLRRVPAEISAEIFLYCRQNSLHAPSYSITDPKKAPLVLGRACASWQIIMHNTPRLWDSVHF